MARKVTPTKAGPAAKSVPATPPAKAAKPAKVQAKQASKVPPAQVAPAAPAGSKSAVTKVATKAKAAPSPPPKPVTVTLKHLAAGLSERRGLPRRDAEAFAGDLMGGLLEQVKAGAKVRIAGLGVIEIKHRPARMARNPATGAPVQVAASRKVVFRAAKDLKDAI